MANKTSIFAYLGQAQTFEKFGEATPKEEVVQGKSPESTVKNDIVENNPELQVKPQVHVANVFNNYNSGMKI